MEKDHLESAKAYIADYLYGVAEDMVTEKYGDTLEDKAREHHIDTAYDSLVEYVKEHLHH